MSGRVAATATREGNLPGESCGFPKSLRLLESYEFRQTIARGAKWGSRFFTLFAAKRGRPLPRIGLTVSRKVGNAVVRNRVKRTLREFYRHNRHQIRPNVDCVLIARPQAGRCDSNALRRDLDKLFARLLR